MKAVIKAKNPKAETLVLAHIVLPVDGIEAALANRLGELRESIGDKDKGEERYHLVLITERITKGNP